jgi:PTS system mannose-specific IIA component/PTS system mannose-specific IIB component
MTKLGRGIGCVIVAHGEVGEGLMGAVRGILGTQSGWRAVTNTGLGLPELETAVRTAIKELAGMRMVVLFTDMPGGSCHHACRNIIRNSEGIRMLTGLNLMMLLEFFVKRERVPIEELLSLVQERGKDSVRLS